MRPIRLSPVAGVRARLRVPGDKSISHRALLVNAIADGTATVRGLAPGTDVESTAAALAMLGVRIDRVGEAAARVSGGATWRAGQAVDCGNSGTTARFLLGILAARASAPVTLVGDGSLSRRPMRRVVEPLARMGAAIEGAAHRAAGATDRLPLTVAGRRLRGAAHRLPVAGAQVKSALLLAGLAAEGETSVEEPAESRDHTERMLAAMGAPIDRGPRRVTVRRGSLEARDVDVPGDFSSAAPFLALAAAREGSEVIVEDVGLNPTRTGFLDILRALGAEVDLTVTSSDPEPRGTVRVRGRGLAATGVEPGSVPRTIDELPLVAVLGTLSEGVTAVHGAGELRVKESDRIAAIVAGLRRMGADIEVLPDGFMARGPTPLAAARLDTAGDHRIAMALAVAALLARGESTLAGADWVAVSYPGFFDDLAALQPAGVRP